GAGRDLLSCCPKTAQLRRRATPASGSEFARHVLSCVHVRGASLTLASSPPLHVRDAGAPPPAAAPRSPVALPPLDHRHTPDRASTSPRLPACGTCAPPDYP